MSLFSLLESHPRLCMVGSGQITAHRECLGAWLASSTRPALILSSTINKGYFTSRFKGNSNVQVVTARTVGNVTAAPGLIVLDGLAQIKTTKHRAFGVLMNWLNCNQCWLICLTDAIEFLNSQEVANHGAVLQRLLGGSTLENRLLVDDEVGQQAEMKPYLTMSKRMTTAHYRQEREQQEHAYAQALLEDRRREQLLEDQRREQLLEDQRDTQRREIQDDEQAIQDDEQAIQDEELPKDESSIRPSPDELRRRRLAYYSQT